jgi:glycosyltransferase involved in cell wall biosynthesis
LEGAFQSRPELLRIIPELVRPIRPASDLKALRWLRGHYLKTRPDLVHTHSGKAGILGRTAAHLARVPVIVHTIHGPSFGPFQGPLPNLLYKVAEKAADRYTTHFISVAQAMTDQYLAAGIGTPAKYTRILSGFDLKPYVSGMDKALRKSWGLDDSHLVIGKIARLFELKGHEDLFSIAAKLIAREPKVRFVFVGDGPWRPRFEAIVKSNGWSEYFRFTGLVRPADVAQFIGMMDVLVHLSLREGLPRVLPQALAAGKPIVSYDCDGAREVCLDGKTGYLIPPRNLDQLQGALLKLLDDAQLRERLGHEGQRMVRSLFSVETMVDQIYALYLKLLNSGG